MVYLIWGENSYIAIKKISELRSAFLKKNVSALTLDFGEEELMEKPQEIFGNLFQDSLFAKRKFIVLRDASSVEQFFKLIQKNHELLKNSPDIFIFWEKSLKKTSENFGFFEKLSRKTQAALVLPPAELDKWLAKKAQILGFTLSKDERATMIEEAGEGAEWALENELEKMLLSGPAAPSSKPGFESPQKPGFFPGAGGPPSPFIFVERMFGAKAPLALKEAFLAGFAPQQFIYPLLWKIKQKKMADAYFLGIQTESAMRRDPKNSEEILERFIFSLK